MKFNFFNKKIKKETIEQKGENITRQNMRPLNKEQLNTFFQKNNVSGINSYFEKFKKKLNDEEENKNDN